MNPFITVEELLKLYLTHMLSKTKEAVHWKNKILVFFAKIGVGIQCFEYILAQNTIGVI